MGALFGLALAALWIAAAAADMVSNDLAIAGAIGGVLSALVGLAIEAWWDW